MKTTKELAKELGILRKRSISSPGQNKNKRMKTSRQIFQYLIVIDFESTCWSNTKLIPQEIIEFPAVLMNTSNGAVESEFHHYVQPQEKPILSEFCCQLTGISQKRVDDGIPLYFCLKRFSQWLEKLYKEKNIQDFSTPEQNSNLCTFVTWSDWDLALCLKNECRRKQLRKPPELNQWIDLRATYRKFYERKPNGLNGALKDLGITFQGREHSGLDDARNTACLAWRMIQDGCVLTITKSLSGVPKPVSLDKPPEKCFVVKEMPTFQNGAQVNILNDRNLGKNNGSRTPMPIQGPNTNIGEKMNAPNKSAILNKNSPPKGSESRLQSKFHENSEMPQISLKLKDSFVPTSLDTKYTTINNNLSVSSTTTRSNSTSINTPSIATLSNSTSINTPSIATLSNSTSINTPSIATLSNSTSINTHSTPFPQQTQSNHIQLKKKFTVYTDSENPNTKSDQVSKKDISFAKDKANISKIVNRSKIISTPSLVIKDISNTFITPNSLPSMKSNSATTLKHPSSNLFKMKSTPPLCNCGRRAKICLSHTPGANMGRTFFTCGLKGRNLKFKNRSVTACNFFKWDTGHLSSVLLSNQSSVSNSAKFKENHNGHNNSTSSLTNSAENTPVLKKTKMRPYQLL